MYKLGLNGTTYTQVQTLPFSTTNTNQIVFYYDYLNDGTPCMFVHKRNPEYSSASNTPYVTVSCYRINNDYTLTMFKKFDIDYIEHGYEIEDIFIDVNDDVCVMVKDTIRTNRNTNHFTRTILTTADNSDVDCPYYALVKPY
jgi:hypothetical protein